MEGKGTHAKIRKRVERFPSTISSVFDEEAAGKQQKLDIEIDKPKQKFRVC